MTLGDNLLVPAHFVKGSKFYFVDVRTRSPKAAQCPKAVTLRVDPNGHILYWMPRIGDASNYIFIQDIVDVRVGRQAAHAFESMKKSDSSTMTVVTNVDFIHPVFTTFVYPKDDPKSVKSWADFLFPFSVNIRRRHFGVLYHIRKTLAPFLYASETKEISLEHLKAALTPCRRDSTAGVALTRYRSNSSEGNAPLNETMSDRELVEIFVSKGSDGRGLKKVFDELCEKGDKCISRKNFLRFLQVFQRDPRLNEARHPKITERGMENLLKSLGYPKGVDITFQVFVHYLWSDFCADSLNTTQEQVEDSMHDPLPCYFINSSHNTYCIGLQVKGARLFPSSTHREALADVEIYRQVLLSGCRCVELDCWDGSDGPVVTHGPTAVMRMNEIPLKVVCVAIDECAFKVSPYPVLLSIENHLSQHQQKLMAQIFRDTFGSKLLTDPLDTHPLVEDQQLPSPYALRYKIIIKAKKSKPPRIQRKNQLSEEASGSLASDGSFDNLPQLAPDRKPSIPSLKASELALLADEVVERQLCPDKEEHSTSDLSRIVNYLTADKVPHTWNVDRRLFHMCSLSEDASIKIYKDTAQRQANNLIKHSSKRLVRVFPANMRITSDNYLPYIHWMMGVQMVALNFQTNCTEMLMNHAMFEQTANCGYVKKPDCLCDPSLDFDIYSGRVPYRMRSTLKITVISALFLPVECKSESSSYYVTLDLFDLPQFEKTNTSYRISSINTTGTQTHFQPKQVIFDKIAISETAFLQICVSSSPSNGNPTPLAYYRVLSINRLQNGYRHVILRSIGNRNLGPISLFVHFDIFYYVKKTQISLHSGLMDPFSSERKDESLSQALRYPFMKQDEADEENDDFRQAIVGTTRRRDDDIDQPTPPVSPSNDTFTLKMARKIDKLRKYFKS